MVYLMCFLCENRNKSRCMKTHRKSRIWITLFEDCFSPLIGILDILNICAHRPNSFFWMALELCSRCTFGLFFFLILEMHWIFFYICLHSFFFFFFNLFLITLLDMWDLSSPTRVEPVHPTVEARSLNHWIIVEVPMVAFVSEVSCRMNS